jgi:hypothetical protein
MSKYLEINSSKLSSGVGALCPTMWISNPLGLVWEPQTRRGLEGLKSPPYSILNKKRILTPPIPSRFWTSKLALTKNYSYLERETKIKPLKLHPSTIQTKQSNQAG